MTQPNADPLDMASLLTQQLNDAYIENARAKNKPEQVQLPDGTWEHMECVECEEPLGARLELGKIRCIGCQGFLEKSRRFSR